jgi:hypothetical protein
MERTALVIALFMVAAEAASAQSLMPLASAWPVSGRPATGHDASIGRTAGAITLPTFGVRADDDRPASRGLATEAGTAAPAVPPWHLGVDFSFHSPTASPISPETLVAEARYWQAALQSRTRRENAVAWWGLLAQQVRVDAVMHAIRLQQPKFHEPLYHARYFEGYRDALKGYYSFPLRWDDGDDFMTNDIGHPIMGAVFSYTFTDYDPRCSNTVFGQGGYWSCMKRAAVYAGLASANWEWNPLMSESALGHIGKFHACKNRVCKGEGGWTDLVVTPAGGMAIRIAGDLARAKLWPVLDRALSGGPLAKTLNYALKALTAPSHFLNCAFKLDFKNAWEPASSSSRRSR